MRNLKTRRRGRRRRGAFTLVELLAVISIIGILVAIVIGVSGSVMQTKARERTQMWMKIIIGACDTYFDVTRKYPTLFPENTAADYQANNNELYKLLAGADPWGPDDVGERSKAKARKELGALPPEAIREIGGKRYFMDGFGNRLWYRSSGGLGGGPYLESAGPDNNFENPEDNIRSDKL